MFVGNVLCCCPVGKNCINQTKEIVVNVFIFSFLTILHIVYHVIIVIVRVVTKVNLSLADQAVLAFLLSVLLGNNHYCISNNYCSEHVKISFVKPNVLLCTL